MNLFCAGLTHHTAPVEVREKFALGHGERPRRMVDAVCALEGIEGAVVLSTCNRVEFYVAAPRPEAAFDTLCGLLRDHAGMEAPWTYFDAPRAVRHLFRVASGLDSMVLGETEILGQVKDAYAAAQEFEATNTALHRLFQHAFRVAKQVRSETLITRGPTSISAAAVELAGRIFGDLSNRRVLIFGAGDTSERTARALVSRGVRTVLVSNRTLPLTPGRMPSRTSSFARPLPPIPSSRASG
jgi:glutamyl-tRNA reductase